MSPTQAREVIEAAGERIADWKSRLRITTGNGINTWDNQGSQLVSVSTSSEEVVKEPPDMVTILWASFFSETFVYPRDMNSANGDVAYSTISYGFDHPFYGQFRTLKNLSKGQYESKEKYNDPDAIELTDSGYRPKYSTFSAIQFPLDVPFRPQTEYDDNFVRFNLLTSKMTVTLSVRTYTRDLFRYLSGPSNDNELGRKKKFDKGQSTGYYDFMIRQEDQTANGYPVLNSFRQRVGFTPVTLNFQSLANEPYEEPPFIFGTPGWPTPGSIAIMGYRKV
jgi:hypothetical protein